jgi:hypothetical protein
MTSDEFDLLMDALQPGLLDWLSGLVVPILLGGLTLWVAMISNRVAKQSQALAERVRQDELDQRALEDRVTATKLLRQYGDALVNEAATGRYANPSALDLRKEIEDEALRLRVGGIREVLDDIAESARSAKRHDSADNAVVLNAMTMVIIKYEVDAWARDPERWLSGRDDRKARRQEIEDTATPVKTAKSAKPKA